VLKLNPALLVAAVLALRAAPAIAQGTFTYTFSGDNSPLNVWATFQASEQAVATGLLNKGNIIGGYVLQGGNQWLIDYLKFPVNPLNGNPSGGPYETDLIAEFGYDAVEIYGGVNNDPYTTIVYWPWVGEPSNWPRTSGSWSMVYTVPEPHYLQLMVFGLICFNYRLRSRYSRPVIPRPRE
jgi:hypothetical protein